MKDFRHPPGTIVVPCQEQARYHRFTAALADLDKPKGTQLMLGVGTSIVDNLNMGIARMRDEDEWVWLIGDDHVFPPDTLNRLLDREVDLIAPLCVGRRCPFPLIHYGEKIAGTGYLHIVQFNEIPDKPFEVGATGSALLIRRHVLDALGPPWFRNSNGRLNEDIDFCLRARAAGFKILVDPQVRLGHLGNIVAWPAEREGIWGVLIEFGDQELFLPGGVKEGSLGPLEAARELIPA